MKRLATIIIAVLLISIVSAEKMIASTKEKENNKILPYNNFFSPEDITLQDDAFHGTLPFHVETWYNDVFFNNTASFPDKCLL